MLKSLFPQVNWDNIRVVGFDLDGTLYDEFDFITQVYIPIANILADAASADSDTIYSWMLRRWLEKGSSYSFVFSEVLEPYNLNKAKTDAVISKCLDTFRGFKPDLVLSQRVKFLLDVFYHSYAMFIVSDGSSNLQAAKVKSLGLLNWFELDNIAVSGDFGAQYTKPSILCIDKISILQSGLEPNQVVFFGDREVDRQFSITAGFQFVPVKIMQQYSTGFTGL